MHAALAFVNSVGAAAVDQVNPMCFRNERQK